MDVPDRPPQPSLMEERRAFTRSRIREAAMEVMARRGFDATVDEIARVSRVSARTIFRHYASHDQLIVATVKDMFEACGQPANELGDDLEGWLDALAVTIHTRNAEILGDAFWDIHTPNRNSSDVLSELNDLRSTSRIRGVRYLTGVAWRAAGGVGEPPSSLVSAFALNFSAFATQALMVDFECTPAQIGLLTADILEVLLHRAVDAQRTQGGDTVPGTGSPES